MFDLAEEHRDTTFGRAGDRSQRSEPLRIGLLVTRLDALRDWHWMVLDRLLRDPRFEVSVRLVSHAIESDDRISLVAAAVLTLDRWLTVRGVPYEHRQVHQTIEKLPVVDVEASELGDEISKLDVVLRLGAGDMGERSAPLARFGEWSVGIGDCGTGGVDWAGFDTVSSGGAAVRVHVVARLAGKPGPIVVRTAEYSPITGASRTSVLVREKSVLLLLKALGDVAEAGALPHSDEAPASGHAQAPVPSGAQSLRYGLRFAATLGGRVSEAFATRLGCDRTVWQLGLGKGTIENFDPTEAIDLPQPERNMADPFLFEHEGRLYIFYEADQGGGGKAWISVGVLENGAMRPLGEVLRRPYHLSYPHVFRNGDDILMLPETQQARRIEVWRSVEFPFRWELHATAFEGAYAADSNLVEIDGTWWLFTNLSDHHAIQDHNSELYLFQVDGPELRQIRPHPRNPVVIGSGTARNAGPIVRANGRLYRPSQINAYGIYGYGLNILEIEALDGTRYEERLVRRFTPDHRADMRGLHHISFARGQYAIDTRRVERR